METGGQVALEKEGPWAAANAFLPLSLGGKIVCIPFASCYPSVTWILRTVPLIIYLLRVWVKSKRETLHGF